MNVCFTLRKDSVRIKTGVSWRQIAFRKGKKMKSKYDMDQGKIRAGADEK